MQKLNSLDIYSSDLTPPFRELRLVEKCNDVCLAFTPLLILAAEYDEGNDDDDDDVAEWTTL